MKYEDASFFEIGNSNFSFILFLAQDLILTRSSFRWFNEIGVGATNQIVNKILCNISLSLMISLSFTLPYLFFNKSQYSQFIKLTLSLSIFILILLNIIANEIADSFYIFEIIKYIIPSLSSQMSLFIIGFPLGIFFITKIHINVNWKLFLLLLFVCPIAFGIDHLNLYKKIFYLSTGTDFNIFFSIILFLNIVSNFYFRNWKFESLTPIEDNILDSPDL